MQPLLISTKLNQVLSVLDKFHRLFGCSVLSDQPLSRWYKLKVIWLRLSVILFYSLLVAASTTTFSTNNKWSRLMAFTCSLCGIENLVNEGLVWFKGRKAIFELIAWCHKMETYQPTHFKKPDDWFCTKRRNIVSFVR